MMRDLARRYQRHSAIYTRARALIARVPARDWTGEIRAIFEWVQRNIRYTRDTRLAETLQTPPATLELGQGDCDDLATLLAAMLGAIGHPARFVAVGFRRPGAYSHVYAEGWTGAQWIALDAAVPHRMGWSPPGAVARMVVTV